MATIKDVTHSRTTSTNWRARFMTSKVVVTAAGGSDDDYNDLGGVTEAAQE